MAPRSADSNSLMARAVGVGTVAVTLARPAQLHMGKPKRVHPSPDRGSLDHAASNASYAQSPHHCRGPKGEKPQARAKPASICPRNWSDAEATKALQEAIEKGCVSEAWEDGFPRYVWHREDDVLYEARHTRGPMGSFHAYPIEGRQAPKGLQP